MALSKRGRFWHYEFQVNGNRYRGSTKQTTQARAKQVEIRKMQEAQENGYSPVLRKPPILREFATAVLERIRQQFLRSRHQTLLPERLESARNNTHCRHETELDYVRSG